MPDPNLLTTDADGVVTSGRFKGHKLSDVLEYAQSLEAAVGPPEPVAAAAAPKADPAAALAAHAVGRVDNSTLLMMQRLEADDEAAFAATVTDYDKYRDEVTKMKQTMTPDQRVQKGVHYFVYSMIKAGTDPATKAVIMGQAPPVAPVEAPPAPPAEEPPAAPPPVVAAPVSVSAPAPVKPKAVPPSAAATPAARKAAEPVARKPKLVATDKLKRQASAFGVAVEEYLLRLEDQGITQEEITASETRTSRNNRRETVYDRALR